jgi:DNA-directed RNA polymerase subunit RPC12/RpoP
MSPDDRAMAQTPFASNPQLDAGSGDALLQLRREDVAVLAAAYLRDSRAPRQWAAVAAGLGGLALGPLLMTMGAHLGWPASLEPYFFFGGWAILLTCGAAVWRRERVLRRRYRIQCPSCDTALLNGVRDQAGLARVELIIATGTCPHCGSRILAP